jgi:hypothetical protein
MEQASNGISSLNTMVTLMGFSKIFIELYYFFELCGDKVKSLKLSEIEHIILSATLDQAFMHEVREGELSLIAQ